MSENTGSIPRVDIIHETREAEHLIVESGEHSFKFYISGLNGTNEGRFEGVAQIPVLQSEIDSRVEGLYSEADSLERNERSLRRALRLLPVVWLGITDTMIAVAGISNGNALAEKQALTVYVGANVLAIIGVGEFGVRLSKRNSLQPKADKYRKQADALKSIKSLAIPTSGLE